MGVFSMAVEASNCRPVLMLVTGLVVCFAGPSQAAGTAGAAAVSESAQAEVSPIDRSIAKPVTPLARAANHVRHLITAAPAKAAKTVLKSQARAKPAAADDGHSLSVIPPSVANANAALTPNLPAGDAVPSSAVQPVNRTAADVPIVEPDQLNELDRAAEAASPPPTSMIMAGAIFMGIGLLLTLATAARMFGA